ncbi:MAG: hypothetical protein L3J82_04035 [Planctomycetes bacterium]|nr:hypothetical protein [Planctomycetota bacterium]
MSEVTNVVAALVNRLENLRQTNPELPIEALLMTAEGREALLDSENEITNLLEGIIDGHPDRLVG